MAVLKLSSLVAQISGKINGTIFAKTKYGQVAKNNSYSLPQNSQIQSVRQKQIQTVSSYWQQLSSSQKSDWEDETVNYPTTNKVGDIVFYSGYNLFLMLNNNLVHANLPINLSVPQFVAVAPIDLVVFECTTANLDFIYTSGDANTTIVLYATPPQAVGFAPKKSDYRQFMTIAVNPLGDNFQGIAAYVNIFGALIENMQYSFAYKIIATNTGNRTDIIYFETVVEPYSV
jgi:hypothetical protein